MSTKRTATVAGLLTPEKSSVKRAHVDYHCIFDVDTNDEKLPSRPPTPYLTPKRDSIASINSCITLTSQDSSEDDTHPLDDPSYPLSSLPNTKANRLLYLELENRKAAVLHQPDVESLLARSLKKIDWAKLGGGGRCEQRLIDHMEARINFLHDCLIARSHVREGDFDSVLCEEMHDDLVHLDTTIGGLWTRPRQTGEECRFVPECVQDFLWDEPQMLDGLEEFLVLTDLLYAIISSTGLSNLLLFGKEISLERKGYLEDRLMFENMLFDALKKVAIVYGDDGQAPPGSEDARVWVLDHQSLETRLAIIRDFVGSCLKDLAKDWCPEIELTSWSHKHFQVDVGKKEPKPLTFEEKDHLAQHTIGLKLRLHNIISNITYLEDVHVEAVDTMGPSGPNLKFYAIERADQGFQLPTRVYPGWNIQSSDIWGATGRYWEHPFPAEVNHRGEEFVVLREAFKHAIQCWNWLWIQHKDAISEYLYPAMGYCDIKEMNEEAEVGKREEMVDEDGDELSLMSVGRSKDEMLHEKMEGGEDEEAFYDMDFIDHKLVYDEEESVEEVVGEEENEVQEQQEVFSDEEFFDKKPVFAGEDPLESGWEDMVIGDDTTLVEETITPASMREPRATRATVGNTTTNEGSKAQKKASYCTALKILESDLDGISRYCPETGKTLWADMPPHSLFGEAPSMVKVVSDRGEDVFARGKYDLANGSDFKAKGNEDRKSVAIQAGRTTRSGKTYPSKENYKEPVQKSDSPVEVDSTEVNIDLPLAEELRKARLGKSCVIDTPTLTQYNASTDNVLNSALSTRKTAYGYEYTSKVTRRVPGRTTPVTKMTTAEAHVIAAPEQTDKIRYGCTNYGEKSDSMDQIQLHATTKRHREITEDDIDVNGDDDIIEDIEYASRLEGVEDDSVFGDNKDDGTFGDIEDDVISANPTSSPVPAKLSTASAVKTSSPVQANQSTAIDIGTPTPVSQKSSLAIKILSPAVEVSSPPVKTPESIVKTSTPATRKFHTGLCKLKNPLVTNTSTPASYHKARDIGQGDYLCGWDDCTFVGNPFHLSCHILGAHNVSDWNKEGFKCGWVGCPDRVRLNRGLHQHCLDVHIPPLERPFWGSTSTPLQVRPQHNRQVEVQGKTSKVIESRVEVKHEPIIEAVKMVKDDDDALQQACLTAASVIEIAEALYLDPASDSDTNLEVDHEQQTSQLNERPSPRQSKFPHSTLAPVTPSHGGFGQYLSTLTGFSSPFSYFSSGRKRKRRSESSNKKNIDAQQTPIKGNKRIKMAKDDVATVSRGRTLAVI